MSEKHDRARRIQHIRNVKRRWNNSFLWRNHTTASYEFQVLDTLRDIRMVLFVICILVSTLIF